MPHKKIHILLVPFLALVLIFAPMPAHAADSSSLNVPGGKLYSNTWRGFWQWPGNAVKWDYQVSAKYVGTGKVERIRTDWTCSASMRSSASLSVTASRKSISASYSSSWQTVKQSAYWVNTKGQKEASYRSNCVVTPRKDYRTNTITITNKASVKLKGNAKTYYIYSAE
ncbi:MAG: hypothetical protein J6M18_00905 [Actinomycetaceae bacterium]|nr:hypothetical protein [Actinomycetaceae bacterium]